MEDEDGIEEERRLFYVASTRAKENLFLLKPHVDRSPRSFMDGGGPVFTQVSRFLDEGRIMDKFVQIEGAGDEFDAAGVEFKEDTGKKSATDKEFLRMMQEYFHDQEEY